MGNFHSICTLLSTITIGKLFGDAGLRDMAAESPNRESLLKDQSTMSLMGNSVYNPAMRLHTLTYEMLMRVAWSGFEEWLEANHAEALPKYNDTIRVMYNVRQNFCRATHDAAMADEAV